MISISFRNQIEFQKERDTSFMSFMNEQPLTASHLAKFTDIQMTSGLKALSENDAHARLESIVNLFVCLYSRDTFLKSYQRELAVRQINKTSQSDAYEEYFLQLLKVECGAQQVSKMSEMMKDIKLSKDLQEDFKRAMGNDIQGVEF